MINWDTVDAAVRAWVTAAVAGSLAADRIYFADQGLRISEDAARIAVRVGDYAKRGGPAAITKTFDEDDVDEEVTTTATSFGEVTVSLQGFSPNTPTQKNVARGLLELCQASLGLPSVRAALNTAGLGVLEEGEVRRIPAVRGVDYEDRAVLDVRMCLAQTAQAKTGYIAKVTGTVTVSGVAKAYEVDGEPE